MDARDEEVGEAEELAGAWSGRLTFQAWRRRGVLAPKIRLKRAEAARSATRIWQTCQLPVYPRTIPIESAAADRIQHKPIPTTFSMSMMLSHLLAGWISEHMRLRMLNLS